MRLNAIVAKSGLVYGPETLKAMTTAYDRAWAEIAHHFEDGGLQAEAYRHRLANAIINVAKEDSTDAELLKNEALLFIALNKDGSPRAA
jgi:hypothetical protein